MTRLLAAPLMLLTLITSSVGQDGGAKSRRTIRIDAKDLEIPDGSLQDLMAFLRTTNDLKQQFSSEYRDTMSKINFALSDAGKALLQNPKMLSDEDFEIAAGIALAPRVRVIATADEPEKRAVLELVQRQLAIATARGLDAKDLSNATTLMRYLDRAGDDELAMLAYRSFAKLFRRSGDEMLVPIAEQYEGNARRLGLLGNSIEVTGKLADGSEFDWKKYRGRVVLVDFWATWCGPCIAEAPNVRKMYDIYHDRGFEVVGISLDTDKKKLDSYLSKEDVPWENLLEEGAGWKHPMAVRYGVNAIPAAWLVDQNGKVVSLKARGGELSAQLQVLIGPIHTKPLDLAVAGLWGDVADEMRTLIEAGAGRNSLMGLVAAQILAGRSEDYAETCRAAFEQHKNSHRYAQSTTVRICCLAPNSGVDPKQMQAVAQKAATGTDRSSKYNKQKLALVLSNFRAGDYQACLDEPGGWGDPVKRATVAMTQAMSAHHLGDREAATRYLAIGNQIIEDELSDMEGKKHSRSGPDHWIACAMAKVLQNEAQAQLGREQP